MNKKCFLILVGTVLSAMLITGCNNNDQDPPPEDNNNVIENDDMNNNNGNNDQNNNLDPENIPGVDEDDNMLKDDENDNDPDPEDPIEDAEDMGNGNKKDE
ncbi:hypothetical protein [Niallia endozanthoxylica]|uniref:Uncharacterized protein n=1 Tax=Niallia endozanthoxylica TaxID=2036016 RepID=A0A5J5HY46_9BACI|nr:hypothetical protein [Niallia endozanthoxylica]KAA9027760.1 hypothetical protein F4V44_05330 [Niallia endozanthoxylica]